MSYTIDGAEYPSVTTILSELSKPALTQWAANCAADYIRDHIDDILQPDGPHAIDGMLNGARYAYKDASAKALEVGTLVHRAIERHIKYGEDIQGQLPDEAANGFLAFLDWEQKNSVEWLRSEVTVCNPRCGYAGTADAIARINGSLYILDFKTSKAIYDEYRYQLAAYREAYNLDAETHIPFAAVLRVDKQTGEPQFQDISRDLDRRYEAFEALVSWYYMSKRRRLKNNHIVKHIWGSR